MKNKLPFTLLHTATKPTQGTRLGKTPPSATEIEESVLGALMLERDSLTEVIDILQPESFYIEAHQAIYQAITTLFNDNAPIDLRTVVAQLRKEGTLERVGGIAYLAKLTDGVASAAHITTHARIIVEQAIRRSLISVSSEVQKNAYDETFDVFDLLDKSEEALLEVSETTIRKSYDKIGNLVQGALKELEHKRDNPQDVAGVPSGFSALDRITTGWQKSDFVVIAARPGMGKTSFLLSILRNAAVTHKIPVAFFSLEMSSQQVTNRFLAIEAEIEGEKIKKAQLKDYEWQQLYHKAGVLSAAPIFIDDTPSLSLFEFRAKCRRLKVRNNIQLIAVDYLQLMTSSSGKSSFNREQEIASISRGLKAIAKELDVPVIAAAQLSRAVETRGGDKRPQLSDLRESGAIEQDVDIAMFLYRPEYYGITEDEEGSPAQGLAEVIVAKHRNGPLGKVPLNYIAPLTKFSDFQGVGAKQLYQNHDIYSGATKKSSKINKGHFGDKPFL
jgi:replicative DNA helicase